MLPPPPRKNRAQSLYTSKGDDSDTDSISSESTQSTVAAADPNAPPASSGGFRSYLPNPFGAFGGGHKRTPSNKSPLPSPRASFDASATTKPRASTDARNHSPPHVLHREEQRVSLRAFLRNFLQNENIARSAAMTEFLLRDPIQLNFEEKEDVRRRVEMDEKRMEEQRRFYEIARQRARELDVHMEKFRRDIVERSEYLIVAFEFSRIFVADQLFRRPIQTFPGDQAKDYHPRAFARVPKVCRVAADRVSLSISNKGSTTLLICTF